MACHGQHERDGVESKAVYFLFSKGVKDDNKSRKVSFGPVSILYISENGDRYDSFLVFPSSESDRQSHRSIQRILVLKSIACKILAAAVGAYVVPGEVCPWCEVVHEEVPDLPQKSLEHRLASKG